jgi:hypothetical protein
MIGEHFFWWLLTMACVAWYSTITIYVALKGFVDIKEMLKRIEKKQAASPTTDATGKDP